MPTAIKPRHDSDACRQPGSSKSRTKTCGDASISAQNTKTAAEVAVKYLTPYFKEGKFASKELFKLCAKIVSKHSVMCLVNPGNAASVDELKLHVKKLVKKLFSLHDSISNEEILNNVFKRKEL